MNQILRTNCIVPLSSTQLNVTRIIIERRKRRELELNGSRAERNNYYLRSVTKFEFRSTCFKSDEAPFFSYNDKKKAKNAKCALAGKTAVKPF